MIVEVMFRDVFRSEFDTGPYTYICTFDVEKDDLVIVNTKYGLSLAKIHKTNLKLTKGDINDLKTVVQKVKIDYE